MVKPNVQSPGPKATEKSEVRQAKQRELLEVDERSRSKVDVANIVRDAQAAASKAAMPLGAVRGRVEERANDADFVDDPDVPPLD